MGGVLSFESWKKLLQNDCIAQDKADAFSALGEAVLRILYDNGIDPTVDSLVKHGLNGKP